MLARLEAIDGVTHAEIDHGGELLRLRVSSDEARQDALATLRELGYGADEFASAPAVERWYGRETVRELSGEEGRVIAARVVAAFTRERGAPPATAAALEQVVARALYQCFATHTINAGAVAGTLRRECVSAVETAVRELLGPEAAHALGALLSLDLESTERRSG